MPTRHNFDKFFQRVSKRIDLQQDKALDVYKSSSLRILKRLQRTSPVITGRYRSGHVLSIHHPSDFKPPYPEIVDFDAIAESNVTNAKKELDSVRPEKIITVFVGNNVPYAKLVEYGGVNNRIPHLVYEKTRKNISTIVREECKKLKKKVG